MVTLVGNYNLLYLIHSLSPFSHSLSVQLLSQSFSHSHIVLSIDIASFPFSITLTFSLIKARLHDDKNTTFLHQISQLYKQDKN